MHLAGILPLFAGLAAALPSSNHGVAPRQTVMPAGVQLASITFNGAGCPAAANPARNASAVSDPGALQVPETRWNVSSGVAGAQVVETVKACEVILKISHPAGWQFSVSKADYYGRVHLPLNAAATSKSTYSFVGAAGTVRNFLSLLFSPPLSDPKQLSKQYYFDGPFDGLYYRNDRWVGTTGRQWSPCGSGASLNLTSEVKVSPLGSGTTKFSEMEIMNLLGGRVGLDWKKC